MHINVCSSLAFIFILISPSICGFDFFLFNRFYKDGTCKTVNELTKYVISGKEGTLTKDKLVTMELISKDSMPIKFGVFFSDSNKRKLRSAHNFFNTEYSQMTELEKSLFPDLISCVENSYYFITFGIFDSYGLFYRLVPTIKEYTHTDLSGNAFSLLNYVEIYMDIFKALKVLISKGYFLRKISLKDIGIVRNIQGPLIHLKGKLRRLHLLRKADTYCYPNRMHSYLIMEKTYTHYNKIENWTKNINLSHYQSCYDINLFDTWHLFIREIIGYLRTYENKELTYMKCIENPNYSEGCLPQFDVIWKNNKIRKNLFNLEVVALRYRGESIVDFLISVLAIIKTSLIKDEAEREFNSMTKDLQIKTEKFDVIKNDNLEIDQINEEQRKMITNPENIKLFKKLEATRKSEILEEIGHTDLHDKQKQISQGGAFKNILKDETIINEVERLVDHEQVPKFKNLQAKKLLLMKKDVDIKEDIKEEFDANKKIIRSKFQRIVKRAIKETLIMKKNLQMNSIELEIIDRLKSDSSKTILEILMEDTDLQEQLKKEYEAKGLEFSLELVQEKLAKQQESLTPTIVNNDHEPEDSEESSEISIDSEEQSLDPSTLTQEELLSEADYQANTIGIKAKQEFEREELFLDGLSIDYDEDVHKINHDYIIEYFKETNPEYTEQFLQDRFGIPVRKNKEEKDSQSEDSLLIDNEKLGELNNLLALKHELRGQLIVDASLKMEKREIEKSKAVKEILELKNQIIETKSNPKQRDFQLVLDALELSLQSKVAYLVSEFGLMDSLFLNDEGLMRTSILDIVEDTKPEELNMLTGIQDFEAFEEPAYYII